ncbi:MAG TPA: prepilin peptidase [Gammaproteobacteria bacterium]|nr:prepilin peptidase [Gammaproteobacteria bacterium]
MDLIHFLQSSPAAALAVAALLGLLVGSFLNVVILRVPEMLERQWRAHCAELQGQATGEAEAPFNLITPASRCPRCGHRITARENIPILSYLLLRGCCAGCKAPIPLRYPVIEAATAVISAVVIWHFGISWTGGAALLLTWSLIALSVIDFDHQLLPDNITLPFLWLGLAVNLFGLFTDLQSAVIGAMAGYLSLWSVYLVFKWTTGKEGMGYGDFKLLAMLGAWLGWQQILPIVLLSSLVGAVTGLALIALRGRDRNLPIPFGPYLAVAGWIVLLWGDRLTAAYLTWMGLRPA